MSSNNSLWEIKQYITVNFNGDKRYYANRKLTMLHRLDGPAIEYADGSKEYYVYGTRVSPEQFEQEVAKRSL